MLGAIEGTVRQFEPAVLVEEAQQALDARWNAAQDRFLALDYDGTLRELVNDPASAVPDQDLLELLQGLDAIDSVEVWVVSGRDADFLHEHLNGTGVGLIAEHGLCARSHGEEEFRPLLPGPAPGWKHCIRMLLETVTGRVRGSHIEEKPNGIAWHYRAAEAESAAWQAHELCQYLGEILANEPLEVLRGSKVIEVRPSGVSKSRALAHVLQSRSEAPDLMVVAGDDITDESMFRGFPDAMSILVGMRPSAAKHRVGTPAEFRALLARWSWLAGTAAVGGASGSGATTG
jgi:trehalose 6-phosphate synthase/phosphatase